jgi:adenosylhomocysteinase
MGNPRRASEDGSGEDRFAWTREFTPVLQSLAEKYGEASPFADETIAVASHLEYKTGVFIETLVEAGAKVLVTGSEPQSTVDDVVTELERNRRVTLFVDAGMTEEEWEAGQHALLEEAPDFILDDGCELIAKVHADHPEIARGVSGGGEQTTVGVTRLEAMADNDVLKFPVYSVNNTPMKHYFDNVHGTGESVLANIMLTTNTLIAGNTVVVAGYGYCGRGIARKAHGLGADTIVSEIDPRNALEASMDGHRVMPMQEAVKRADYVITATGNTDIVRTKHLDELKDGVVVANAGHFDVEIDVGAIEDRAIQSREPRDGITQYEFPDGRKINVLAAGRLVNLTGPYSSGHPAEVMDTTFAMMFMAAYDLLGTERASPREPGLYAVPDRLDRTVADMKLEAMAIEIDTITEPQSAYRSDWEHENSAF